MNIVYLNGQYVPLEEAKISVMDRGFLFGDGVYEYIPVYNGEMFRLKEHLARLNRSLEKTYIKIAFTEHNWLDMLQKLIEKNGGGSLGIYLQITRGVASKRDLAINQVFTEPTLFAMCMPLPKPPADLLDTPGIKVMMLDDTRWANCYIKAITLLPSILLKQQALDAGMDDAILVRNSHAMEGTQSNLFIVKNEVIITPPKTNNILAGVTRDLIVEFALHQKWALKEGPITVAELMNADEIWLTSSSREIIPVVELDKKPVSSGKPGPIWQKAIKSFQKYKQSLIA